LVFGAFHFALGSQNWANSHAQATLKHTPLILPALTLRGRHIVKTHSEITTEKVDALLALALQPHTLSTASSRSVWRKVQRNARKLSREFARERSLYRRGSVDMTLVPLTSRLFIDWFGLRV
jgi:hypothetical protein